MRRTRLIGGRRKRSEASNKHLGQPSETCGFELSAFILLFVYSGHGPQAYRGRDDYVRKRLVTRMLAQNHHISYFEHVCQRQRSGAAQYKCTATLCAMKVHSILCSAVVQHLIILACNYYDHCSFCFDFETNLCMAVVFNKLQELH